MFRGGNLGKKSDLKIVGLEKKLRIENKNKLYIKDMVLFSRIAGGFNAL